MKRGQTCIDYGYHASNDAQTYRSSRICKFRVPFCSHARFSRAVRALTEEERVAPFPTPVDKSSFKHERVLHLSVHTHARTACNVEVLQIAVTSWFVVFPTVRVPRATRCGEQRIWVASRRALSASRVGVAWRRSAWFSIHHGVVDHSWITATSVTNCSGLWKRIVFVLVPTVFLLFNLFGQ